MKRSIRRPLSLAALILSLLFLAGAFFFAFYRISANESDQAHATQVLNDFSRGNRQAFCNTERLLLVRAIQNGYTVPANASVDVCGLPIIGNPPLPHEGQPLPPGAPIPAATSRPAPASPRGAAASPHSTATTPTAPRPAQSPTPVCVLIVCVG